MEVVEITLVLIDSNKVYMKLKGLSNEICLELCLLVKQIRKHQKLKIRFLRTLFIFHKVNVHKKYTV